MMNFNSSTSKCLAPGFEGVAQMHEDYTNRAVSSTTVSALKMTPKRMPKTETQA
jgi:hypothetical protein